MKLKRKSKPRDLNRISIQRTYPRGQLTFTVVWYEGATRKRRFFGKNDDAETFRDELRSLRTGDSAAWLAMSPDKRSEIMSIVQQITESGTTLNAVWAEHQRKPVAVPGSAAPKTIKEVIDQMLASKARSGSASPRHLRDVGYILRDFARGVEAKPVAEFTPADIEAHLVKKGLASRKTMHGRLGTLFNYALRQEFITRNPVDRTDAGKWVRPPPKVFKVEEVEKVLAWFQAGSPSCFASFVLSTFCGLRPEEALKTTWDAIRLDAPDGAHVVVEAHKSKKLVRRIVYPMPAAVPWLRLAKERGSKLPVTMQVWRGVIEKIVKLLGWQEWDRDTTRHTAASYWMAAVPNAAMISEQLGHDPKILKSHYQALVTRGDAERFWNLVPH